MNPISVTRPLTLGAIVLALTLGIFVGLAPAQAQNDCADDAYEENDDFRQAPPLAPGAYPNLRICPGDDDWFRVSLPERTRADVNLSFSHVDGDLDLYLMDASGVRPLASSISQSDNEHVAYTTTVATTAYIRVTGYGDIRNVYTLTYTLTPTDDPYEPNDTPPEAPFLSTGTYTNLMLVPGNPDFFAVQLPARSVITATVYFDNDRGDIDLWLTDRNGNARRSSTRSDRDWEQVVYPTSQPDYVYLYLRNWGRTTNVYTLTIDVAVHWPCQDDPFAPNHTAESAAFLNPGLFRLMLCPTGEDWFSIQAPGPGVVDVTLNFIHQWADLDLYLYAPDASTLITQSIGTTDVERVRQRVTAATQYLVQVQGREVIVGAPYTLSYTYATFTPTPTPTFTPTPTPTSTPTPTFTPTPTQTPTPTPTPTPTLTPTPTATPTPSPTPTPVPPGRFYLPLLVNRR